MIRYGGCNCRAYNYNFTFINLLKLSKLQRVKALREGSTSVLSTPAVVILSLPLAGSCRCITDINRAKARGQKTEPKLLISSSAWKLAVHVIPDIFLLHCHWITLNTELFHPERNLK